MGNSMRRQPREPGAVPRPGTVGAVSGLLLTPNIFVLLAMNGKRPSGAARLVVRVNRIEQRKPNSVRAASFRAFQANSERAR